MLERRSLLRGLAALPLAAAPCDVGAAVSPDAALFDLAPKVEAAIARDQGAFRRYSVAEALKFNGQPSPDYVAAEAELKAAEDTLTALRNKLMGMPARTVAGLALKIRVCGGDPELDPDMMASIAADILAMDGAGT